MIKIDEASFSYENNKPVIKKISFEIKKGESVGLIGANGCGKSTLLRMISGLLKSKGVIEIDGLEVKKENLAQIRRKIGLLFQDSDNQLFMPRVYDDMVFGLKNYGLKDSQAEEIVDRMLEKLDIMHLKNKHNYALSGGEKRMVCIATILAMSPEALLLDEPTITLDPYNRRKIINTLNELDETKLIASHDLDMILETCERVIMLKDGCIEAVGSAQEILCNSTLLASCHLELPFCMQEVRVYNKRQNH